MQLACPVCGPPSWTVRFSGETWRPVTSSAWAGGPVEFIAGRCTICQTMVLLEVTREAAEIARRRMSAAEAMAKVAGHG